MKYQILVLVFILLLFSCGKSKEEKEKELMALRLKEKEIALKEIKAKYQISFQWDTLNYAYSFYYKTVINTPRQVIDDFEINDIYWSSSDSLYHVSLELLGNYTYYFDLKATSTLIDKLTIDYLKNSEDVYDEYGIPKVGPDLILIVNVCNINKVKFETEKYEGFGNIVDIINAGK